MTHKWQDWCRLCGTFESAIKIECIPEILEIIKKFTASVPMIKICEECFKFLNEIYSFNVRCKTVENMFMELLTVEQDIADDLRSLNEIRARYGLDVLTENFIVESISEVISEDKIDSGVKQEDLTENFEKTHEDLVAQNNIELTIEGDSNFVNIECEISDDHEDDDGSESDFIPGKEPATSPTYKKTSKAHKRSQDKKEYEKSEEEKLFDFICHICRAEFPKMCYLRSHCKHEHNCVPQVNCMCGKTLSTWKRLLIHKRKHFPEQGIYECKDCKLTYQKQSTYEAHVAKKHGSNAKSYVCSQCGRAFKEPAVLKKHERTHLPDELKLTELCTICNKKFVNKNSLQKHIDCVHIKANIFTCETCGKSFSCKSNLKSHFSSHSTEKTVACDQCDKKFKTADCLRKHKRIHMDNFLTCPICGNNYRTRQNLIGHLVVHSDVKKFKCTFCPNEYKRSKDLKCHLNLHTGERPYACPFCDRTFVNGSNCRKHKLKDHPIELQEWEKIHGKGKTQI